MANRFVHITKLAEIRRDIRAWPNSTDRILKNALIRALPNQHKSVYFWATECAGALTSAFVAEHWHVKQNHASGILAELWQWGLLNREAYTDEHGRWYRYKVAE